MYEYLFYGLLVLLLGLGLGAMAKRPEQPKRKYTERKKVHESKHTPSGKNTYKKTYKDLDLNIHHVERIKSQLEKCKDLSNPSKARKLQGIYKSIHGNRIKYSTMQARIYHWNKLEHMVCTPVTGKTGTRSRKKKG